MILPIVKQETLFDGVCKVPEAITYSHGDSESEVLGGNAFASFVSGAVYSADEPFIELALDLSLEERDEIYRVLVSENKIKIGFRDARGAINGSATVALLLRKKAIPLCEIIDYPSCSYRSVLIDIARGMPNAEDIKSAIKYMALAKYNRLHLHLIDAKGPCYVSSALPEYKYIGKGEPCNKSFLRELDELCRSYAIEIVPEIEIPAHATALCEAHPEFKCQVDNAHSWTICPGNDDIWDFFSTLVKEVSELFPRSEYLHIGTDELEFSDLETPRLCHWDDCPRCASLRQREGLTDRQAEFYYVVDKMHDIVKSNGKKMMMWNDQIDTSRDVPISRDILLQFWRIAYPGRGPYEGCTFEKLLENGFKVINSFYRNTYFDLEKYLSSEKMQSFTPFSYPEHSPEYDGQIIGSEACAWEFGNYESYPFYGVVTPSVVAIFGDKLWGLGEREHGDEYRSALAEFIFGREDLSEIFEYVGGLIPPRSIDEATYPGARKLSASDVERCIERLRLCPDSYTSKQYTDLIKKIAAKA